MKLIVTEKNDAAVKIADLLGATKPKADKVFNTPVYRFDVDGEEWVTIGLRGHILEPDFTPSLIYKKPRARPYPPPCPRVCRYPPSKRRSPSLPTAWN